MISNQKQSNRALLTFSGVWAGLVMILAISFFDFVRVPLWSQIALAGIIALVALFFYHGGFYFIQLEVKNNRDLMVKYYNLFPAGRKFKAFQVPLKNFHHHEIIYGPGKLTSRLVLFQKMQGGIAKYPGIGLSATNKEKQQEIDAFLRKLAR